jgi:hypothetical protein
LVGAGPQALQREGGLGVDGRFGEREGFGGVFEEKPYRWSQRWHDDPPVGTIVLGDERVIYLGNGVWQALDDTPND